MEASKVVKKESHNRIDARPQRIIVVRAKQTMMVSEVLIRPLVSREVTIVVVTRITNRSRRFFTRMDLPFSPTVRIIVGIAETTEVVESQCERHTTFQYSGTNRGGRNDRLQKWPQ